MDVRTHVRMRMHFECVCESAHTKCGSVVYVNAKVHSELI